MRRGISSSIVLAIVAIGCESVVEPLSTPPIPLVEGRTVKAHIYLRYGFDRGHADSALATLDRTQMGEVETKLEQQLESKVFSGPKIQKWDDNFDVSVDQHGRLTDNPWEIIRSHFNVTDVAVLGDLWCADCEHGIDGKCKNCVPLTWKEQDWLETVHVGETDYRVKITAELVWDMPHRRMPATDHR